jgi:hypothetical protein
MMERVCGVDCLIGSRSDSSAGAVACERLSDRMLKRRALLVFA